jgi:hypothetical protein
MSDSLLHSSSESSLLAAGRAAFNAISSLSTPVLVALIVVGLPVLAVALNVFRQLVSVRCIGRY